MRRAEIRRLLPAVFQAACAQRSPLDALVGLMEHLHAAPEQQLAGIATALDPRRAPERFVPFLARWVALDPELALAPDRLRALVAAAADLSRWRGTARGLVAFLELATGRSGFRIEDAVGDETGAVRPFHLRVIAPEELRPWADALDAIVAREKPAYVTHELQFA